MQIPQLDDLMAGRAHSLSLLPDGAVSVDDPPPGAILSGAFNPLHAGHLGMARAAGELSGLPVAFELAVLNADKGVLSRGEVVRRAAQFAGKYPLILSRAPLFASKAALYPGRTFVLGYDTAARLLAPHYYDGPDGLAQALAQLRAASCHFLVAGRLHAGRFQTLADLVVPSEFTELFTAIPEAMFRADLSSTALRKQSAG